MLNLQMMAGPRVASPVSSPRSPHSAKHGEVIRLAKDLSELDLPPQVALSFPHGMSHSQLFEVAMTPDEGCYAGGTFLFQFRVPDSYPADPPRVRCLTQVFHPCIDDAGNVDMSLLGDDWRPDMSIKHIIYGLWRLFLLPESEDSLNTAAGSLMHSDRSGFERAVEEAVHSGATIEGKHYEAAVGQRNVHSRNED